MGELLHLTNPFLSQQFSSPAFLIMRPGWANNEGSGNHDHGPFTKTETRAQHKSALIAPEPLVYDCNFV
jgi:hypothetical protein